MYYATLMLQTYQSSYSNPPSETVIGNLKFHSVESCGAYIAQEVLPAMRKAHEHGATACQDGNPYDDFAIHF